MTETYRWGMSYTKIATFKPRINEQHKAALQQMAVVHLCHQLAFNCGKTKERLDPYSE